MCVILRQSSYTKVRHYVPFRNNVRVRQAYTVNMQLHFVELATFLVRNSNKGPMNKGVL